MTLEENYKTTVDNQFYGVKNSPLETEPINIEVQETGANAMISWLTKPPTTLAFKYDENGMTLKNINLYKNYYYIQQFDLENKIYFYQIYHIIFEILQGNCD